MKNQNNLREQPKKIVLFCIIILVAVALGVAVVVYVKNQNEPKRTRINGCSEEIISPSYYVGMMSDEAKAKAAENGAIYRVVSVDGESKPVGLDNLGPCGQRVNVALERGVVTEAEYY